MHLIALTGALATGKSTVSKLLRSTTFNIPIIDADVLAREVVEPGSVGYNRVVSYFGPSTPDLFLDGERDDSSEGPGKEKAEGSSKGQGPRPLNRAALGRRVFGSDPDRQRDRKVLNGITHPLVRRAMVRAILYYYVTGQWAVVCDIPLLYESGLDIFASTVIMVAVRDPVVQMRRLRERDTGLSEKEAEERVGSQMSVKEKVGRTLARGERRGKVVWNDQGVGELEGEVKRVVREIERGGWGSWGRWWLWSSPLACAFVAIWVLWCGWRDRRGWEKRKVKEGE